MIGALRSARRFLVLSSPSWPCRDRRRRLRAKGRAGRRSLPGAPILDVGSLPSRYRRQPEVQATALPIWCGSAVVGKRSFDMTDLRDAERVHDRRVISGIINLSRAAAVAAIARGRIACARAALALR